MAEEAHIHRLGRSQLADEAFHAWTSGDLQRMLRALEVRTNPIDRHFLLQSIIAQAYKRRSDPSMLQLCLRVGLIHLDEFASIAPALAADMGGRLPRVPAIKHTAMILEQVGEYEQAMRACEVAIQYDLNDGTKGGFRAHLARLKKRRAAQ